MVFYINDLWSLEVARQKTNDIDLIIGYNYDNNYPGIGGLFTILIIEFTDNITKADVIRSVYNIAAKYRLKAGAKNTYVLQFSHMTPTQNGTAHECDIPFMLNYLSPKLEKYLKESDY